MVRWLTGLLHLLFALIFAIFGSCGIKLGKYHWELAKISLWPYGALIGPEIEGTTTTTTAPGNNGKTQQAGVGGTNGTVVNPPV